MFNKNQNELFFIIIYLLIFLPKLVASDGVQQSRSVTVDILVIDANDNTPTFSQVSYSVEIFTNMLPGETVLQVRTLTLLTKSHLWIIYS